MHASFVWKSLLKSSSGGTSSFQSYWLRFLDATIVHQISIKYLIYLILNKRKLVNKQPSTNSPPLPKMLSYAFFIIKRIPHLPRGRKYPYRDAWLNMNMVQRSRLPFTSMYKPHPDVSFIYLFDSTKVPFMNPHKRW